MKKLLITILLLLLTGCSQKLGALTPIQNVKVYTICDPQSARRVSIDNDLQTFKARNPDNSLRGLNGNEKSSLKSCEIAKRGNEFVGFYDSAQYGTQIEIVGEVKAIEINGQHGIELFARAWEGGEQLGFGVDGSVDIERFRFFNPPILVDDPNGDIERAWTFTDTEGVTKTGIRKLREDPKQAILSSLAGVIENVNKNGSKIVSGKIGNTTSTFYPQGGAGGGNDTTDARMGIVSASTFALARDTVTATSFNETETWQNVVNTSIGFHVYRSGYSFLTSAIGADTISSATFSYYENSADDVGANDNTTSIQLVQFIPAVNNDFAVTDYTIDVEFLTTSLGSQNIADKTANAYNPITINATGIALISKIGVTPFGLMTELDRSNTAPTGNNRVSGFYADQTGTDKDPKLTVEHSAASAPPSQSSDLILFE